MKIEIPDMKKIKRKGRALIFGHDQMLDNFFDVDRENMVLTATITIEKATDILNTEFKTKKGLLLNDVIWEKIGEIIDMVPSNYRLKFIFEIRDLEGYDPNDLMAALQAYINMKYYRLSLSMRKKKIGAFVLAAVGILLLALNVYAQVRELFGDTAQAIITEVIDIAAWVFVWEAVTIYFLDTGEMRANLKTIRKRLIDITICDINDKRATSETTEKLFENRPVSIFEKLSSIEPMTMKLANKIEEEQLNEQEEQGDIDILTNHIETDSDD